MKDNSISVKDTPISEKDTTGIVTEVLRDAPHRKVKGDVLDSQPILGARTKGLILRAALPRFPPVLQRMRKATGTLEGGVSAVDTRGRRRDFCSDLSGPSLPPQKNLSSPRCLNSGVCVD